MLMSASSLSDRSLCAPPDPQMRVMGIRDVLRFPFPSAPPAGAIRKACRTLTYIGALESSAEKGEGEGAVTAIGRLMAKMPIKYVPLHHSLPPSYLSVRSNAASPATLA